MIRRSSEKKNIGVPALNKENSENGTSDAEMNDDVVAVDGSSKKRTVRDVVTPLADVPYADQLEQKKSSLMQILKKLVSHGCVYFIIIVLSVMWTFLTFKQSAH